MQIAEIQSLTADEFHQQVIPAGKPVIIRKLVSDWPLVAAFREGNQVFSRYLLQYDRGVPLTAMQGPASIQGRIFYNQDLSGLNCRATQVNLAQALEFILTRAGEATPPTLAIQSIIVPDVLPGLEASNTMPLLPASITPRIWIGGRAIVAAHYDPMENIACCVAGRRRFTLFPPEQVSNLYPGPFELTPAGATISMVDFDDPDFDAFPRFREAQAAAMTADLEPGDVLYIPYLWWHHVRALDDLNVLVNYWWGAPDQSKGDPRNAMFYAMMALQALPAEYRQAWQAHFDHYVFHKHGDPAGHLPKDKQGIIGGSTAQVEKHLKQALIKSLHRPQG